MRSILLKIIYNDEYENIDANLSDSNVGGRKTKNIRNHLFIVNGIINESIRNGENVDLEILDYKQFLNSKWLDETVNDFPGYLEQWGGGIFRILFQQSDE